MTFTYKNTFQEAVECANELATEKGHRVYIGKKLIGGEYSFAVTLNLPSSRRWVKEKLEFVRFVRPNDKATILGV